MENPLTLKIAVITDDGKTISQHFGRALYYLVVSVENGQVIQREMRQKLGHANFKDQPHSAGVPHQAHGQDPASHQRHLQMAETIADCQVLLCRGMGRGAYESMQAVGIRPIVTDIAAIDEAVLATVKGEIINQLDRLH